MRSSTCARKSHSRTHGRASSSCSSLSPSSPSRRKWYASPHSCSHLPGSRLVVFAPQLVERIEPVRESRRIREEWFGLILLPFVSFSADGAVAVIFFCQAVYDRIANKEVQVPSMLALARRKGDEVCLRDTPARLQLLARKRTTGDPTSQ